MKNYNCKKCGANLYWNANSQSLKCEYCDAEYSASDFEYLIDKSNLDSCEKHDASKDEHGFVTYKCQNCGAEIVTQKSTVATTCAYCGEAVAITEKMVDNFKPDTVIPFEIDKQKAEKLFRKYCKKTILTPKKFYDNQELEKITGVFIPFWLHSFLMTSDSTISGEKTETTRSGDDKIIIHHKYNIVMESSGSFSDIPTDGLKNMNNQLMNSIEPFDYSKRKKFNAGYMAGFYAEEYNEDCNTTLPRARDRAQKYMKSKILKNSGNYEQKHFIVYNDKLSDIQSSYAMIPVWLFNIKYKNKKYLYAINGQTGKVAGKLPISFPKLLLYSGMSFLATQIIAFVFRLFN